MFDKTKDQKVIHKDTNDSWNSVLNLLVYSKYPTAQSLILEIWFLLTCFHQMLSCPEVFDETKYEKIIHKDMKDSWNSVLDLLVYSKCPIK